MKLLFLQFSDNLTLTMGINFDAPVTLWLEEPQLEGISDRTSRMKGMKEGGERAPAASLKVVTDVSQKVNILLRVHRSEVAY